MDRLDLSKISLISCYTVGETSSPSVWIKFFPSTSYAAALRPCMVQVYVPFFHYDYAALHGLRVSVSALDSRWNKFSAWPCFQDMRTAVNGKHTFPALPLLWFGWPGRSLLEWCNKGSGDAHDSFRCLRIEMASSRCFLEAHTGSRLESSTGPAMGQWIVRYGAFLSDDPRPAVVTKGSNITTQPQD
jgi:hypothetical protein